MTRARDLFGDVSVMDTGVRSDGDFYETPAWMTRSLLTFHPAIRHATVLECACGRGAITRVLQEVGCRVVTNDIDPAFPADFHLDARLAESWQQFPRVDYVVTNLPFTVAIDILPHAVAHARIAVASVLLKSFDEPTEDRGAWLHRHPWTRKITQPRHNFRGEGSPSMASDWFIWELYRNVNLVPCVVDHLAKTRTERLAA
jgi:hypothetical protein